MIFSDFSDAEFRKAVSEHRHTPIVYMYQSDGWGATVNRVFSEDIAGKKFRRMGKYRHEFLMERAVLKFFDGDTIKIVMNFSAFRQMGGKKAWNIFVALMEYFPLLKELGHDSVSIHIYLQDGLMSSPILRLANTRQINA